jgi:phospholipid/cholesterol/gamma-HCH transport system permease protein
MMALPLITVVIAALAIAGGFLVESVGGNLSWPEYWRASFARLDLSDLIVSPAKTTVFGYLIGATACYCGLHARGGTQGVGQAATRSVVYSIFLVVLSDVLLVRILQAVA